MFNLKLDTLLEMLIGTNDIADFSLKGVVLSRDGYSVNVILSITEQRMQLLFAGSENLPTLTIS